MPAAFCLFHSIFGPLHSPNFLPPIISATSMLIIYDRLPNLINLNNNSSLSSISVCPSKPLHFSLISLPSFASQSMALRAQRLCRFMPLGWAGPFLQQQAKMEEVLRRINHIRQRNIQRKRIEKALEAELYPHNERKKYDFREDMTLNTPRTNLPFEDQIRFDKDLYETRPENNKQMSSIFAHPETFRLPLLAKKQRPNLLRRKFRGAVWAVVFLNRMEVRMKETMMKRKRRAQKCYKNLLVFIEKLIRCYYEKELKEELANYISILEQALERPKIEQEKEVTQMLYYVSEKLSKSTVTKDILEFLVQSSVTHAFPPSDFLAGMEIARLDFSVKYGCLIEVSQQQTRMLVGLCLGVKIFCFYVLSQPWKLGMATQQIVKNGKSLKELIGNITSVYYFMIIQEFCFKVKEVRTLNKNLLSNFAIRPIMQLDPFGEGTKEANTAKHLFVGQSRTYLSKLELDFPQICSSIRGNLIKWINRVSYACLKQAQRKDRRKDQSVYYRTIDKPDNTDRRVYKSLQINRKQESGNHIKKSLPLPSLKYTIQ